LKKLVLQLSHLSIFIWLMICVTACSDQSSQNTTSTDSSQAKKKMRTIGLIGGTSWHSTIEYYSYINQMVNDIHKDNTNPPLIIFNLNQKLIHDLQKQDNWDSIAQLLSDAGKKLKLAGAEAIVFCANTPHKVYNQVQKTLDIPILHIADATGEAIQEKKLNKVGLIGTIYTMEENFITSRLKEKYNIEAIVPDDANARKELHRIIQQELTLGIFKEDSKKFILNEIEKLKSLGAQGIVLGCTEFPLVIKPEDVDFPVFNTTYLHAEAAVKFILSQ
jgi:aspartate racemase